MDSQCPSGQVCANGRCEDKCNLIDCAPGYACRDGKCFPVGVCDYDYQCTIDKKCVGRRCVDKCTDVVCPYGSVCSGGSCVPVNLCAAVTCPSGSKCENGACIPLYPTYPACYRDNDCKNKEICNQNQCTDSCIWMKCSAGYIC